MHLSVSKLFLLFACYSLSVVVLVSSKSSGNKNAKEFSLFSVVTFQNGECTSDSSIVGGATAGTCYTSTECGDRGGTKSGNCASGFGVCCVFINAAAAAATTISENRTRVRNAEYPSTTTATTLQTLVYTINKMKSDICQIRLDFTTFVIAGPSHTGESITAAAGSSCQDSLIVTTSDVTTWTASNTAKLCGKLTGEHLYIELSPTSTDAATLTLAIAATPAPAIGLRSWDIKTSQIECHATYRAPPGCQRFFTEDVGKIVSYNFGKVGTTAPGTNLQNAGMELALQRVNTCIRRSKNMCCIEYQLCQQFEGTALADADVTESAGIAGDAPTHNEAFTIDVLLYPFIINAESANSGLVDSQCVSDYVEIPSSFSSSCGAGSAGARNAINTRYCGSRFGANGQVSIKATTSTPVCDCSEPFIVRHGTDDGNDKGGSSALGAINTGTGVTTTRGFCLDYHQIPCWY